MGGLVKLESLSFSDCIICIGKKTKKQNKKQNKKKRVEKKKNLYLAKESCK